MSTRSKLLFQAQAQISNPFLLCSLISGRTRQLMMSGNTYGSTAELVDYALSELLAGALEFEMPGEKEQKNETNVQHTQLRVTSREALEVEAT